MHVLEKVSKAISRNYNVKVVFRGTGAATDGDTIYLPSLPDSLTDADEIKIRGYCDHEISHLLFTDIGLFMKMAREKGPAFKNLMNVLEDIRCEGALAKKYPGARENIQKALSLMLDDCEAGKKISIMSMLWRQGRINLNGFEFPGPDYTDAVEKILGEGFFGRLAACESTADVIALTASILKSLEKSPEPKPEGGEAEASDIAGQSMGEDEGGEAEASDPDGQSTGEDEGGEAEASDGDMKSAGGTDDGDTKPDGPESGDDLEDGEDGPLADEGGDGAGDRDAGGGGENRGEGSDSEDVEGHENSKGAEDDASEGDIRIHRRSGSDGDSKSEGLDRPTIEDFEDDDNPIEAIKKDIEEKAHEALRGGKEYMVYDRSYDEIVPAAKSRNLMVFEKLKASLGPLNVVKGKMANIFLTRTASRWMNDRESGRVNPRTVCKIKTGCRNIFREKYISRDTDTAVTFLVDFSGSMGRCGRIEKAMTAVVAFLEMLQATKVKSEVLGYTTGIEFDGSSPDFGRVESLRTLIYKAFDEPYGLEVKKRISGYNYELRRENCDGDSVKVAYDRLMARPERRKILIVLTDGVVANHGNIPAGRAYLKSLINMIERQGAVEIIGIGIDSPVVAQYYKKSVNISDSTPNTALAAEMTAQLKTILKV